MRIGKIVKEIIVIFFASYLGLGFYLYIFQTNYIYFPDDQDFASCRSFQDSQKINVQGTRAYFRENSDKLIVFYHGNAGSACDRSFLKGLFEQQDYSYIFVEYSGYAGDSRKPKQELLMTDVRNINDFLATLKFSHSVIAGESIGAALAAYHSSLTKEDKLLLVSPFDKIVNVAWEHYPYFPVSLLLREKYDTTEWVNDVKSVMIIHGAKDTIIPLELGQQLFEGIKTDDKVFVTIPDADHNDLYDFPQTYSSILDYLKN